MDDWQGPFAGLEGLLAAWATSVGVVCAIVLAGGALLALALDPRMATTAPAGPREGTEPDAPDRPAVGQPVGG